MSPPELSDNQLRLMATIRDSESVQTTELLGSIRTRERTQLGADAARKALGRLESRDPALVRGEGSGRGRSWWLTEQGLAAVNELRPARDADEGATGIRGYVLVEETTLAEVIEALLKGSQVAGLDGDTLEWLLEQGRTCPLYEVVGSFKARNTEHAFRQVAKGIYGQREDGWRPDPESDGEVLTVPTIAIDDKRWRTVPVRAKRSLTVSVG